MIVMTIVMTPIMRGDCCALHALKVRGVGLAWGVQALRLQWRAAPTRTVHMLR